MRNASEQTAQRFVVCPSRFEHLVAGLLSIIALKHLGPDLGGVGLMALEKGLQGKLPAYNHWETRALTEASRGTLLSTFQQSGTSFLHPNEQVGLDGF